eukprot:Rhum_TRINITY_DN15038_c6_g1::Rhum_TRINITY_DN15038_c6_g1_i1::g.135393::m.135393
MVETGVRHNLSTGGTGTIKKHLDDCRLASGASVAERLVAETGFVRRVAAVEKKLDDGKVAQLTGDVQGSVPFALTRVADPSSEVQPTTTQVVVACGTTKPLKIHLTTLLT